MGQLSQDLAPWYLEQRLPSANRVSTFAQGHKREDTVGQGNTTQSRRILDEIKDQGVLCPYCPERANANSLKVVNSPGMHKALHHPTLGLAGCEWETRKIVCYVFGKRSRWHRDSAMLLFRIPREIRKALPRRCPFRRPGPNLRSEI